MAGRSAGSTPSIPTPPLRATVPAQEGRLVATEGHEYSRLMIYMLGNFLHRIETGRREAYFDDLDLARVSEIIALAGVEPGMRDAEFRAKHSSFASVVGVDGQRAMNASSIASALGMSRETVRRKLKQLLKLGFIQEKGRAQFVLTPGVMQQPLRQALFAYGIQQVVQLMNECLEQGVVRWTTHQAPRGGRTPTRVGTTP